ncbi:LmeA family phospholipid-binding protein [Sinosporangium siamense]|uniref:DUF2993 domain-containing protein n=1 Tax=Sinosporangium siamense TaxID=1367973 RepID=A0A919RIF9_9ACTN|nr:DUF2993 domain-containing protein [Sinosporangium siamense]GII93395.1 hypothetical protein Ssi02_36260 [Sinosporangium siamense]
MRKLIVGLILLAIALAVVDRVAVSGAQSEIARQIAASYNLRGEPEVTIEGIPFLTQAVSGRYDEIKLKTGPMTQRGVRLKEVEATLYGVDAPLLALIQNVGRDKIRADRVVGSVVISHDTLKARAPSGIEIKGEGDRLSASGDVVIANVKVPVKAFMKFQVIKGGIRLSPEDVTLAGGIPVPENVTRSLTYDVPVRDLPLGLRLTDVRSVPEGLRVSGEAEDVALRG